MTAKHVGNTSRNASEGSVSCRLSSSLGFYGTHSGLVLRLSHVVEKVTKARMMLSVVRRVYNQS